MNYQNTPSAFITGFLSLVFLLGIAVAGQASPSGTEFCLAANPEATVEQCVN